MGIMPSEFWAMTADEFLTLAEFENDEAPVKGGAKITKKQAQEMANDLSLSDAEWWAKHGVSKN